MLREQFGLLNEAGVFFAVSITEYRGKKWKEFQLRLCSCVRSVVGKNLEESLTNNTSVILA